MGKCIKNFSSRNDILGENTLAFNKVRDELTCEVDKIKNTPVKENASNRSGHNSSSRISSHSEKKVKHHQKESPTKETKISNHHKKSSNSQTSKKYVTNNSSGNISIESSLHTNERKETSVKHISYDPYLDICEAYNPKYPDLFPMSKSIKKERDTCDPNQFHSSKSIKKECGTYKPSVKRKLEVQSKTVCESKPKKLKFDQISEKRDKHKKHDVQGSKSQLKKEQSLNQKKENNDESLSNSLKEKSSDKSNSSKCTAKESGKNKKKSSKKAKLKINSTVEFTSSEANFEDCLGLNDIVIIKKKSSKPIQTSTKTDNNTQAKVTNLKNKHPSSHSFHLATPKKSTSIHKEKFHTSVRKPEKITKIEDVNIMSTLPQTLPNYRPLPRVESHRKKKEVLTDEDATLFMSSKREKTAVYSGRRSYYTEVPSLFEICTRVLIDNIDYIEYLGYMPYHVLKPVLEKCNPQQLLNIENYNPYLLDDTDKLWEVHCKRDCKLLKLEENETYRELYLRAQDERERKLKSLTANISASMSKYNPARQVKLVYVDSVAKPPRDVARKQAKNGTSTPVNHPVKAPIPSKATPTPAAPVVNSVSSSPSVPSHVIKTKPKVAPLMAKTLKSMKQCFRR